MLAVWLGLLYGTTRKVTKHGAVSSRVAIASCVGSCIVDWGFPDCGEAVTISRDFDLNLVERYEWIREVMLGVERLLREGLLKGDIFHVRDSWVGIHRVGGTSETCEF